jgi:hypothetical protein
MEAHESDPELLRELLFLLSNLAQSPSLQVPTVRHTGRKREPNMPAHGRMHACMRRSVQLRIRSHGDVGDACRLVCAIKSAHPRVRAGV